jgi:hypothetical protein
VVAKKGEQMSLIAQGTGARPRRVRHRRAASAPVRLFAYSGRNLYRPGEKFDVSVMARDADGRPVPPSRCRPFCAPRRQGAMDRHLAAGREVRRLLQADRIAGRCRHRLLEPRTARRPGGQAGQHGDAHWRRGIPAREDEARPRHQAEQLAPESQGWQIDLSRQLPLRRARRRQPLLGVVNTSATATRWRPSCPASSSAMPTRTAVRSRSELEETALDERRQGQRRVSTSRRCRSAARPSPCAPR